MGRVFWHKRNVCTLSLQLTGRHSVRDVSCKLCEERLGWIYVSGMCTWYVSLHVSMVCALDMRVQSRVTQTQTALYKVKFEAELNKNTADQGSAMP